MIEEILKDTAAANFKDLDRRIRHLERLQAATEASELIRDYFTEVVLGNIAGQSIVSKFGHNTNVGTSLSIVSHSGNYRTPTAATALEIVSSDAGDTAAGAGAQEVTIEGLDSNWAEVSITIEMNGTTPAAISTNLIRLYRLYVSRSGTYASQTAGSHIGQITVQESGAGSVWNTIPLIDTSFGQGQGEIGAYTIPAGKKGVIYLEDLGIDSGKAVNIYFFKRENADDVTAPYSGVMRVQESFAGLTGEFALSRAVPLGVYPEKTDVAFLSETTTGSASVSVSFDILLIDI